MTQAIEKDIIDTLKDMIEAVKGAIKENKQQQQQGSPKAGSPSPQNQKLIDQLQELKMVRAMEIRVYKRTVVYGKEFPHAEQLPLPKNISDAAARKKAEIILKELKDLAEFQDKIRNVARDIATGKTRRE